MGSPTPDLASACLGAPMGGMGEEYEVGSYFGGAGKMVW